MPTGWMELVKCAKKKAPSFKVRPMALQDFKSVSALTKVKTHRKTDI